VSHDHDLVPEPDSGERTVSTRVMELVVSGLLMAVAVMVIADSLRVGAGWAFDGPEAGYFPFFIGVIMFISSAVTFAVNLLGRRPDLSNFVSRPALSLVFQVLAPSAGFVVLIWLLGLYVAAAIFICFFMMWLGKYPLAKAAPVALGIPFILFWLFEKAFLIPLPKGPLEAALGY
jgi:putative tricarboxylic transport membrane protein